MAEKQTKTKATATKPKHVPFISLTFRDGKSTFGLTAAAKGKSALAKAGGDTWGAEFDFSKLPASVVETLVIDAVQAKLRTAVKKLDPARATREEVVAAMRAAFEALCTGKKAARTQSEQTKIRAEARRMLKASFKERNYGGEELDAAALTEFVSDMFKAYDKWAKTKDAELEPDARIVENALNAAEARLKEQAGLDERLNKLIERRKAEAAGRAAEEATEEAEAEAEAPAARPTPTAAEQARRQGRKPGAGRSA